MAIKQGKAGKKSKAVAKKLTKKAKQVEDDVEMESETDDSSEEETVIKSKPNGPKAAKTPQDSSEEDSEEDSEEESEEEPPKKAASKKASQKKVTKQKVEDEDEEDDEDDSEEEQQPKGKAPLAQMEDDDEEEEEEDDEESEEEVTPKISKAKKAKAKKQESDEEDSEEESEEEEMDDKPVKKGKNGKVQQAEEESEEEESDEGESEEEEEEKTSKKRKAKAIKTQAKKQKTEDIITIKVGNIPELVTDEKLVKFFTKKGVETTDFRRNVKRGFGFLDLADPDSLETALALSGEKLKGSELTVEKAEPKRSSEKTSPSKESTGGKKYNEDTDKVTLFMKNLPFHVEVDEIKAVFPDAVDVRLAKKGDGSLRGFGFIEFSTEAEADEAMEANQGTEIGGRAIMLDFMGSKARNKPKAVDRGSDKPRARGEAGKTKVLFVGNLSFDTTVEGLKEAFEGCSDARIIYRDDGSSKGIGFVEYNSPDDAKAALDTMSGTELDGRQMHLDYASERGSGGGGGGRGGFRGGRGGGFRGGRDGGRGGFGDRRGGFGDRRGSFRGGRGGTPRRDGVQNFQGKRKTFDD